MKIRRAILTDVEELRKLMIDTRRATYPLYLAKRGEALVKKEFEAMHAPEIIRHDMVDPDCMLIVCEDENKRLVGYAKAIFDSKLESTFLDKLYLLKDFQGQGLGRVMFNHCQDFAIQHGCQEYKLYVSDDCPGAIEFYKKQGMKIISTQAYYVDGENTGFFYHTMTKPLTRALAWTRSAFNGQAAHQAPVSSEFLKFNRY